MKLKINDKIKIIDNNNEHSYNIWDECYIIMVYNGFYDTSKTKWGEYTYAWSVLDEDCILVEETITPWMMVGVSNDSQEDADKYYRPSFAQYYIWRKKDWNYVTDYDSFLMSRKYISIKKEWKISEYTLWNSL